MINLISILGSTGSVGLNTLKIIDKKRKKFKINLLASDKNYKLICSQIKKYKPNIYVINDLKIYLKVKKKFKSNKTLILNNFKSINCRNFNITICAIPGLAGLEPTIAMIKFSSRILIANKESIICGWNLIQSHAKRYKTELVPIDSEHYSIKILLKNHNLDEIDKIYITASGGPFLNYKAHQFKKIRPKDALKHPKWKMGKKISVDSSTLMNKILEVVEANKLFRIPLKKLEILIHPNSLVHAIVQLKNGLTKFIYHDTSMIIPLANAIFNGNIQIDEFYKNNKKKVIENLIFRSVNPVIFPIIKMKKRLNEYPSTSIIVNAANEILVDQFLQKKIPFSSISKIIMTILNDRNYRKYAIKRPKNIKEIYKIDEWTRRCVLKLTEA